MTNTFQLYASQVPRRNAAQVGSAAVATCMRQIGGRHITRPAWAPALDVATPLNPTGLAKFAMGLDSGKDSQLFFFCPLPEFANCIHHFLCICPIYILQLVVQSATTPRPTPSHNIEAYPASSCALSQLGTTKQLLAGASSYVPCKAINYQQAT